MEKIDYWRLCDDISIFQALMLCIDVDPADVSSYEIERDYSKPRGYEALKTAIVNAVRNKTIKGNIAYEDSNGYEAIDLDNSILFVESLKSFLTEKSFRPKFFFPENSDDADYLNSSHPCYSSKLAATIKAWEAVTQNHDLTKNKTPKAALEKWLRENAAKYGLTDDDGNPIKQAIEDMSKVANWQPKGGAAKTFVALPPPKSLNPPTHQAVEKEEDLENEACPF